MPSVPRTAQAFLTVALATVLAPTPRSSEAIEAARITAQVRWDIGAAMPDGPEDEPVIHALRAYPQEGGSGREDLLVCLTLGFRTPEPGETGAVLLYARNEKGRLQPQGPPFYHGLEWLRGEVPLADACEAAETRALHSEASLNPRDRTP
jgi:hypothetical protein